MILGDDTWYYGSEPIGQDFGDEIIGSIAKADGMVFCHFCGVVVFGKREIFVLFISVMGRFEFKTLKTMFFMLGPTTSQNL